MESKHNLNEETVDQLQKLIRANIDSYNGYKEAGELIKDAELSTLFRKIGDERSAMASELQKHVKFNGEEAVDDGSVAAKTHRIWMNIKSKIVGEDTHAILAEAERGEDHIKHAYEEVLKATGGSAMNDVLTHQYAKVKAGHDQIRDLRDAFAEAK